MRDDICRRLKEDKSGDAFFTTMIDLYAIPDEFPGLVESEELRREPLRRVEALEQAFAADIGDPRFIPYIQLHEYEAYLFSDPMQFVHFYADCQEQIADLEAIARAHQTPEFINDRPDLAPSKRIIRVFPDYDGAKAVVGPLVAECIGIETIRNKCPHFNSWLLRLEGLGSARTRNAEKGDHVEMTEWSSSGVP